MRAIALLILLAACSFAYVQPPFSNVSEHNDALAPFLLNSTCLDDNATRTPTYDNPISCAEMELLTAYPSVDRRISGEQDASLLWRYAYGAEHYMERTVDTGECLNTYQEFLHNVTPIANTTLLAVRNYTFSLDSNPAYVPAAALAPAIGQNATFRLEGALVFAYMRVSTVGTYYCNQENVCTCVYNVYVDYVNFTRDFRQNLTYDVEGGAVPHFLATPALAEQWARNNLFGDLAFSNREFYFANLTLDNATLGTARMRSFNITNGSSGAWGIISSPETNSTNLDVVQTRTTRFVPATVDDSGKAFNYVYSFSSSYSGTGTHNLTLSFGDEFGNNFSRNFTIASRLLTFSNSTGEDGSTNISDRSVYRPSAPPIEMSFSPMAPGIGVLGALILLFLLFRK